MNELELALNALASARNEEPTQEWVDGLKLRDPLWLDSARSIVSACGMHRHADALIREIIDRETRGEES